MESLNLFVVCVGVGLCVWFFFFFFFFFACFFFFFNYYYSAYSAYPVYIYIHIKINEPLSKSRNMLEWLILSGSPANLFQMHGVQSKKTKNKTRNEILITLGWNKLNTHNFGMEHATAFVLVFKCFLINVD